MHSTRSLAWLGLALVAGGALALILIPEGGRVLPIAGIGGGALCGVWAARCRQTTPRRAGPILTLAAIAYLLLTQVVTRFPSGEEASAAPATIAGVLLAGVVGVLVQIVHSEETPATHAEK